MKEIWKPVFESGYEISDKGRVRRADSGRVKTLKKVRAYRAADIWVAGRMRRRFVHRLVAEAFIGPRPLYQNVNHINGIKHDNRPENLEYTTPKENSEHASRTGLIAHGERCHRSKLTAAAVIDIRTNYRPRSGGIFSRRYKITIQAVHAVVKGHVWKHI